MSYVPILDMRAVWESLCETRWVERHKVINEFVELFPTIIHTLQSLREKDNSSIVYLNSVLNFEFVVCLKIMEVFSSLLMPISIALQRPGCDLLEAFEEIKNLEKLVQNYRYDVDSYFDRIYEQILKIAEENDIEQSIPRICRRQQNRFNVQTENAQQYYKITVFIPFIDHLLSEISERFGPLFEKISFMQMFIPNTIKRYSCKEIEETVKKIEEPDVNKTLLMFEIERWRLKWLVEEDAPKTALAAFKACSEEFFPNIKTILKIFCIIPVTTSEAERSFSTLRRLKTWLRSSMLENRLNGLALLNVHKEIEINISNIINKFSSRGNRRLELLFSRQDQ